MEFYRHVRAIPDQRIDICNLFLLDRPYLIIGQAKLGVKSRPAHSGGRIAIYVNQSLPRKLTKVGKKMLIYMNVAVMQIFQFPNLEAYLNLISIPKPKFLHDGTG